MMSSGIAFLLVTCCLEPSRVRILNEVLTNLVQQSPMLRTRLTVFDNASTEQGVTESLVQNFENVFRADKNVGYWSAIDWWLHEFRSPPTYTYIIESDMVHYDFAKLWDCQAFLDNHPDVGSVRLHEYSVENRHLYDKENPRHDSRRNSWHVHTNKVTGKPVAFFGSEGFIHTSSFLTQLPALNRFEVLYDVFAKLEGLSNFSELDFQRLYWERYQQTGILDGGIYNCDSTYDPGVVTGSWTTPAELKRIGYQPTRNAKIIPSDQYTVVRVR